MGDRKRRREVARAAALSSQAPRYCFGLAFASTKFACSFSHTNLGREFPRSATGLAFGSTDPSD